MSESASVTATADDSPAFELECLFDDMDDPTTVTVFYPRGSRTVTEWITADVESSVRLDRIH